jgi:integrase
LILNHDIPVIVVFGRLGHAQTSITMDVYGHLIPRLQVEASELIDALGTPTAVKLDDSSIFR